MNIPYEWIDASHKSPGLLEYRPSQERGLRFSENAKQMASMIAHSNTRSQTDLTVQPAKNGLNIVFGEGGDRVLLSMGDTDMTIYFYSRGVFTGKSVTFPNGKNAYCMDGRGKIKRWKQPVVLSYTCPLMKMHFFPRSSIELIKETPTTITYRSLEPVDKVYLEAFMGEAEMAIRFRDKSNKDEFIVSDESKNGKETLTIRDLSNIDAGYFEYRPIEHTISFFDKKSGFVLNTRGQMKLTNVDMTTKAESVIDLGNLLEL